MAAKRGSARQRLAPILTAMWLASMLITTSPAAVAAHCPGTAAHDYAYGNQSPGVNVNAVVASIDWTQGNVCTSGVSHSVSVCSTGSCVRWAQAGWRYYNGYAEPRMYCEWAGGVYKLVEFGLTHARHAYKQQYDSFDKYWDCYLDSTFKYSWSLANSGFSQGTYVVAQGENHQAHVQIGKMLPAKLQFVLMMYRKASDGSWPNMNITPHVSSGPYGADEPAIGQLRVWTNAH
jgi:hypothetical protein